MKTQKLKTIITRFVIVNVLATFSIATWAQSTNLPRQQIKSSEEKSYFDLRDLTSNYVSWGINPENPASINLSEAWKKI